MPKVVIAEDEFMNLDMIAEVLADSGYDVATLPGRCRKGSNSASGISPNLPPSIHTLLIAALSRARGSYGTRYYGSGSNGYGSDPNTTDPTTTDLATMGLAITDTVGRNTDLMRSFRGIFRGERARSARPTCMMKASDLWRE
jgi:hypothetical protein